MKAYSNMETGYINEGEISIFLMRKFYFYLNLNKKVLHVGYGMNEKEKISWPDRRWSKF